MTVVADASIALARLFERVKPEEATAHDVTYLDLALRTGAALATFDVAFAEAMRYAGGTLFDS